MTGRDLKFHQRHPLQCCGISLAILGGTQDGFSQRLHVRGTDRLGQRGNRRVQRVFHHGYGFGWKRCVREIFHLGALSINAGMATLPHSTLSNRSIRPRSSVRFTMRAGNRFGLPAGEARSLSPISSQIAPVWIRLILTPFGTWLVIRGPSVAIQPNRRTKSQRGFWFIQDGNKPAPKGVCPCRLTGMQAKCFKWPETGIPRMFSYRQARAGPRQDGRRRPAGFVSRRRRRIRRLTVAADLEGPLEPRLFVLIRDLRFIPLVLRLNLAGWFGRRGVERAGDDFSLRPCLFLGRRRNRLCVVRCSGAQSVPPRRRCGYRCSGYRRSGYRRAIGSQRTAIREHQRGEQEYNAFRNHRGHL